MNILVIINMIILLLRLQATKDKYKHSLDIPTHYCLNFPILLKYEGRSYLYTQLFPSKVGYHDKN